ncbi:hypothetical protein BD626DRAFT_408990 [Schizophyllum amplum]|uniref:MINDY deubiquitinase domain-containing protein n=1 Tax=Schizophyllum amplum TaxID=97359 RepID=A0A550C3H3_9AGAR|nr:hypothetical protein BD626DRAFT_408990 [Auriculariopsis ampla]
MSQRNSERALSVDVWYLKEIAFGPGDERRNYKIITQNFNGPCSLIAICNILILRGKIEILPPSRKTVSYDYLSQLVADYLLTSCPDVDISAALSIMPHTQQGMHLNPVFTGATSFRPGGDGGELKLFEQAGIRLVHGWLVDPASADAEVIARYPDYDAAVSLIAEVDHLTQGQLVLEEVDEAEPSSARPSAPTIRYTEEEKSKIRDAIAIRDWIHTNQSQLTYHGLFHLATTLPPNELVALFRSSHLSVLYRADDALYGLATDAIFLHEPSIVWERLEDVDGGWSTFVDADFRKSVPAGGDFAGEAPEMVGVPGGGDMSDHQLAQQLQAEEERRARAAQERYEREKEEKKQKYLAEMEEYRQRQLAKKKSKSDCTVM